MSELRLLALGGMGNVTQNMYVYEYEDEMLLVDCGIGFPDVYMPGVDILIPDISYIQTKVEQGKTIVGMILTHGHDDHIGALPYLLGDMPVFPIYASPLTAGFAQNRMKDSGVERAIEVIDHSEVFKVGNSKFFTGQAIRMTHSVPDTRHYAINTPEGIMYHGSDFKLDPHPVDGVLADYDLIKRIAEQGVLCMLIDSLRVERSEWSKSESTVGPALEKEMTGVDGMVIVTLMSSHIHRIQQTVNAALKLGRKIVFVGRSVEQNVEVALHLGKLDLPRESMVDKRELGNYKPKNLCIIIAGSQGQEGSSLMRAVYGDHPVIQIKPNDKVLFSADVIPGNELNFYGAIDELCRNGVQVVYPDLVHDLHQSGHAAAPEQAELLNMVKPKYVMPIGGADRHRVKFAELVAEPNGYDLSHVLLPENGGVLGFENGSAGVVDVVTLKPRIVDGLGIGDVGPVVLSDRRALGQAGIIVLVIPRDHGQLDLRNITIVSRGFVFMKEADDVINFIKESAAQIIDELGPKAKEEEIKRAIEKRLARKLYKVIKREPMIVPVMVDV